MSVITLNAFEIYFHKKNSEFVSKRNFHSLTYRISGKISITDDKGKTFISEAPAVTYLPKGMSYSTEIIENGQMIAIHFDAAEEIFDNEIKIFDISENSSLYNLFASVLEKQKRDKPSEYAAFSVFYDILSVLSGLEQKKIPSKMRRAKKYIDENFKSCSLSVSEIAETLNLSEVYLRKEFKKHFGSAPLSYINKVRISNAKAMLKTGYYSVSEISMQCGFLSLSYFSYAFRKATGSSPSEYAKHFL